MTGGRLRRLGALGRIGTIVLLVSLVLWTPSAYSVPMTFVVTTTADDAGPCDASCSLREAMTAANANPGADTIEFDIPGTGVHTIAPGSGLPSITEAVTIDGTTESDYVLGDAPRIEIDGASAGPALGLFVTAASTTIRGLTINRFEGTAIQITAAASNTTLEASYIGLNAAGTAAAGNANGIHAASTGNTIGGSTAAERNVIAGNTGSAIVLLGDSNTVQGNYVGTTADGMSAVGNVGGVGVSSNGNTIGGPNAGEGNVLSGATDLSGAGAGVEFFGDAASNTVEGNLIGTNKDGTAAIPNSRRGIYFGTDAGASNVVRGNVISGNSGDGIDLFGNSVTVHGNLIGTNASGTAALANAGFGIQTSDVGSGVIGGTTAAAGNVISGNNIGIAIGSSNNQVFGNAIGTTAGGAALPNTFHGIQIVSGTGNVIGGEGSGEPNRIRHNGGQGVRADGGTGNRVSANEISDNGGSGIDLNGDGVTPNDVGDGDSGPNNLQNFPALTSVTGGASTSVAGSLDTAAGSYRVEFFANAACDGTHGEGARFLGGRSVPPGPFTATGLGATSAGEVVTATATDASGNTSEFSACQALSGGGGTLTVQNTNDSGAGSLRQAIIDANAAAGHDDIEFDLDNKTISLLSPLPAITDPVDIHGISLQTGNVILDGTSAGDADGLVLGPGSGGSTIEDLEIRAFSKVVDDSAAIRVESGQNHLEGNLLHDVDVGVLVTGASAGQNIVGGDSSLGDGNTIWNYVFEGARVEAAGAGNRLSGNTVGRAPGGSPDGGVTGVRVVGTPGTAISALTVDNPPGDPAHVPGPSELFSIDYDLGNVVVDSGEFGEGIRIEGAASTGTVIAGNFVGTGRSAVPPNIGNGGNGIEVAGVANNQVGPGNTVWFNDENGVLVSNAAGNRIVANSINSNGGLGISLSSANGDLAAPDLGFATTTNITGFVDGVAGRDYFLELFSNDSCTGAEGKSFVGFLTVQNGAFDEAVTLTDGASITATVTDSVTNDTSELSNCVTVSGGGGGGAVDPPVLFAAVPDATPNELGIAGLVEEAGLPAGSSFQVQFYSSPQCNSASPTALGTRTVTTNANGVAAFALEHFPNVADGIAVRATASRGGPPSEFSNCVIADPNNTSWPTALAMGATSTRAGYLRDQGQARWFKVPIVPNSHVDLRLSGLPGDYDMVVFGDIAAAYDELVGGAGYVPSAGPNLALDDLNRQGANAPADVFNTSQYNPSSWDPTNWDPTLNTANFSPSQWSPSQWSPSQWSASQWSPSQWSPSQWSPSQWSPSQWSPSQWSPSQWSSSNPAEPSAFATAQTSTVLAVSGNTGTGDENVSVNTWNNTGFLYVRVQGKNGIYDPDDDFTLDVSRTGNPCSGVVDQPSSPTAPATNRRTLILVDGSRMAIGGTLSGKLSQLAARPEVRGAVVNVGSDPVVASLNTQADGKKACPYAKNLVASAITRIVNAYRATNPLEYVVVVGDDSVIPFYRYPDPALLGNEKLYVPPVRDDTASQASLRLGFVLNQDGYGSSDTVSLHGNAFPVPDLAVGRLVETPAEVEGMLDAYLGTSGGVVPTPTSSLTTGYDFLQDAADVIAGHLSAGIGGANNDTLITNRTVSPETVTVGTSPDRNHSWTGADLRRSLLNSGRHDLIFLAGHFSANDALGADYRTNVLSTELPASSTSFVNSIVFSAGCHTGYNIVNGDATTWTEPLDWAQAFARKRATLISGTGYQYGDTDFLAHSERIYAEFARQLRVTTGAGGAPVPVSVGRALLRSKQLFLETTPGLTALDEKALLQATLFGLPMLSVNLPQGRIVEAPDTTVVPGITPVGPGPGAVLGLGFADLGVGPSLTPQSLQLKSGPLATWLSGPDGVAVRPTQPILPLDNLNVTSPSPSQALRGVAFRSGTYTDTLNVTPLTSASATELRGVHAPFFTDVFFPTQPWTVNFFGALGGGATRLHATPVQHLSSLGDLTKSTRRQFSNLDLRLFYSGNTSSYCPGTNPLALAPCPGAVAVAPALAAPPTITGVETEFDTGTRALTFKAQVLGELVAGIQSAWVTWTVPPAAGLAGTWQSLDLEADPDEPVLWTGTMTLPVGLNPANIRFVVQAVNGVGRVKIDDNVGAFYQPGSIPGQQEPGAGAPDPTAITFTTAPPSSVAFGSRFTVVARLASGGTPVPGELVRIGFGSAGVPDSTNSSGEASVSLGASLSPGTYVVTASFAGDATHAPSDAVQTVQVTQRPTTLALTGTLLSSNPLTATLTADPVPGSASAALNQRNVFLVIKGGPLTQVYSSKTDPKGRVQLPDSLLATLPPRIYTVDAYFNGATLPGPVVVAADDVDYAHAEAHQTIDSWLGSAFSGFVGMSNPPVFNNGKAGSAMPIKFSLGANRGLAIFATGYPKVGTVPCGSPNATPTGLVVADSNGLKIDTKNNQYTWDWKTGSWKGTCRALIIRFADGTEKKLLFRF